MEWFIRRTERGTFQLEKKKNIVVLGTRRCLNRVIRPPIPSFIFGLFHFKLQSPPFVLPVRPAAVVDTKQSWFKLG